MHRNIIGITSAGAGYFHFPLDACVLTALPKVLQKIRILALLYS